MALRHFKFNPVLKIDETVYKQTEYVTHKDPNGNGKLRQIRDRLDFEVPLCLLPSSPTHYYFFLAQDM